MTARSPVASATGELARERDRVVQRLRSMALPAVPVDRVHGAVQELADLAADAVGGPRRTVPVLEPYAAGDQVAVLALEVVVAAESMEPSAAAELLAAGTGVLTRLRRAI